MGAGQTRPRAPASRCDHVVIPAEIRGILHVDIGFHRRLQRFVAENPPCGLGILGMRVEIELRGEVAEEMCAAAPAAGLEGTRQGGPVDWLEVLTAGALAAIAPTNSQPRRHSKTPPNTTAGQG